MQHDSGNTTFGSKIARDLVTALGSTPDREEVLCRCPLCGDSKTDPNKKRFAVNLVKGKYHCFNCFENGGMVEMAHILLNLGTILSNEKFNNNLIKKKIIDFKTITVKVSSLPEIRKKIVINDLLPRKIFTLDELLQLDYGLAGSRPKKWIDRIIIEVDGIKFGKSHNNQIPKYITQPNFRLAEHGYINNSNIEDRDKPVILTEGLLDFLSLPSHDTIMSSGTSGLFNDLLRKTSYRYPIIEVPDSDDAGVTAFLRVVNKGMLADPKARLRFFFAYWVTDKLGDDINDLLLKKFTKEQLYHKIVEKALPGPTTLSILRKKFDIIETNKGLKLASELKKKRVNKNVKTRFVKTEDTGSKRRSRKKEDRARKHNAKLSWF